MMVYDASMNAELILKQKFSDELENLIEMKIWKVPVSQNRPYGYKYSLVYIVKGKRIIRYDNETGRGDHRHYEDTVEDYRFESAIKLVNDFKEDILNYRKKVKGESK